MNILIPKDPPGGATNTYNALGGTLAWRLYCDRFIHMYMTQFCDIAIFYGISTAFLEVGCGWHHGKEALGLYGLVYTEIYPVQYLRRLHCTRTLSVTKTDLFSSRIYPRSISAVFW